MPSKSPRDSRHAGPLGLLLAALLLCLAGPSTSVGHGSPHHLGDEPDKLPDISESDISVMLNVDPNGKHHAQGLGGIRLLSGGKQRARNLMTQIIYNRNNAHLLNGHTFDSDTYESGAVRNSVICTAAFKIDSNNTDTIKIERIHYQEHKPTGLAWIEYRFRDNGNWQYHRLIFLNRICPSWSQSGAEHDQCEASNGHDFQNMPTAFVPEWSPGDCAKLYPNAMAPNDGTPPRDPDGGGGGEM